MGKHIKDFADGSYLEYDQGQIDEWCVYLSKVDGARRAPKDIEYFGQLKNLAGKYGIDRIYSDFVRVL